MTTTYGNQSENQASYTNQVKSTDQASIWAVNVFPWQLALPWQFEGSTNTVYDNQTKH
jgi:hypothetical protein